MHWEPCWSYLLVFLIDWNGSWVVLGKLSLITR